MSIYNLDKIFHPASVAVIGASPREGTIGFGPGQKYPRPEGTAEGYFW